MSKIRDISHFLATFPRFGSLLRSVLTVFTRNVCFDRNVSFDQKQWFLGVAVFWPKVVCWPALCIRKKPGEPVQDRWDGCAGVHGPVGWWVVGARGMGYGVGADHGGYPWYGSGPVLIQPNTAKYSQIQPKPLFSLSEQPKPLFSLSEQPKPPIFPVFRPKTTNFRVFGLYRTGRVSEGSGPMRF